MAILPGLYDEALIAARGIGDYARGLAQPTVRLGVTGLSRAGKTVFITALVNALIAGGRLPVFAALSGGRIAAARLSPQPDDAVPRFEFERHLKAFRGAERQWPDSTRQISELRIEIDYQSARGMRRAMRRLALDIVDYPGEWLLDLPLLDKDFATWSAETLASSRTGPRRDLAAPWHDHLAARDPDGPADEPWTVEAARLFTDYLRRCRDDRFALSLLPPGRFLMPGDLAGSPALTFSPVEIASDTAKPGSLRAMMERRYEAYLTHVVRPFFREHFARLDRQIVLVDALAALNAGPAAVADLEAALTEILKAFRPGRNSWLSAMVRPRIDRILFAATKADHLHHTSHDRLEKLLARLAGRAIGRAEYRGATIDVVAMAAVRATREATIARGRDRLPAIIGTPIAGERAGGDVFDGSTEIAVFPGDLPEDPAGLLAGDETAFLGLSSAGPGEADYRFVRFRPQGLAAGADTLPHIRLDRALEFLIGDRLA